MKIGKIERRRFGRSATRLSNPLDYPPYLLSSSRVLSVSAGNGHSIPVVPLLMTIHGRDCRGRLRASCHSLLSEEASTSLSQMRNAPLLLSPSLTHLSRKYRLTPSLRSAVRCAEG